MRNFKKEAGLSQAEEKVTGVAQRSQLWNNLGVRAYLGQPVRATGDSSQVQQPPCLVEGAERRRELFLK